MNNDPSLEEWFKRHPTTPREVTLSVVVPAYNEEFRLPPTLIEMIDILDTLKKNYEIIIVDDGSSDRTAEVVKRFEKIRPQIRLITLARNCGKGHAVRTGALNSRGEKVLFADADGSTPFSEMFKLYAEIEKGSDIAFGSRALLSDQTKVKALWYRRAIGRTFNFLVTAILLPGVADTQCGFKMFTASAAEFVFSRQSIDGFNFDVEILYIARKAKLALKEVPVNWHNMPGSKVNLLVDSLKMLISLFTIRMKHSDIKAISPALSVL
jgi:dolichyl-phosphate beta-glucosyltransferase